MFVVVASGNAAFPQLCFTCRKHCLSFQFSYNFFERGSTRSVLSPGSDVFEMSVISSDSTLEHVFIIIRQPETFRQLSNTHSQ